MAQYKTIVFFILLMMFSVAHAQTIIPETTIRENTTWGRDKSPYIVEGIVRIENGAVLRVVGGVRVEFKERGGIHVGTRTHGVLEAITDDPARFPVVFTSHDGKSFWYGIESYGENSRVNFDGVLMEFAGDEKRGERDALAGLRIGDESSATIRNSTFAKGAYVGVEINTDAPVIFQRNKIMGMKSAAISVSANAASAIGNDNVFANNGMDAIIVGEIGIPMLTKPSTWSCTNYPYVIPVDLQVENPEGHTRLTLEAGVRIKFPSGGALTIGWNGKADLIALGSSAKPIVFEPLEKSWDGVYLGETTSVTILQYCIFSSGGEIEGMLNISEGAKARITRCTFENSQSYGVFFYKNADIPLENCVFAGNKKGNIGREK